MPTSTSVHTYELTFILGEKATQDSAVKKVAEYKKYLTSIGGTYEKEELWGRRELAYIIKRNRNGFYVTIWFTLPQSQVRTLEEHMRFDEDIIRSLVTKAYKNATPGTLYPVKEETEKPVVESEKDHTSAEEELRRSSSTTKKEPVIEEEYIEDMPEEERLKKLEETLDEILKDDKEA